MYRFSLFNNMHYYGLFTGASEAVSGSSESRLFNSTVLTILLITLLVVCVVIIIVLVLCLRKRTRTKTGVVLTYV